MRTPGRNTFGFAMFGFAITAVFVSYQLLTDLQSTIPRNSTLMIVLAILCPPSLISILTDTEVGTNGFYLLWTMIAVLNAALYAALRTILSSRLQKPD
jgi:hypothetical protein